MGVMARLKKSETVIRDQRAEVMTAGVGAEVTKGEEAGAEVMTATTDEAEAAVTKEGEATVATTMIGGEVTAVSYQTGEGAHYQDPGHVREVERVIKPH